MLNLVWTGTFASSFMVTMPTLSGPFPNLWLLMMLLRVLSRFSWPLALKCGGPKQSDSTEAKGSGLKRKLPPPSPMPNIHERPPTPPSVPGTPPQPPTPPLTSRLLPDGQQHGGSGSEYAVSSESSDGEPPAPPESFHQVIDLARGDFDRALALALDFWMRTPNIDWDGDINGVADLRILVEGNLIYWVGTFSALMCIIQLLQQTKLEQAMSKLGWLVTVQFMEYSNPVKGRVLILPNTDAHAVNQDFFITFMKAAFVVLALPRGVVESPRAIYIKMKVWGHPAFRGWLHRDTPVQSLLDAWHVVGRMIGESPPIRAVAFSGTMNPEFTIGDYKGGPHRVSKKYADFRCQKRTL